MSCFNQLQDQKSISRETYFYCIVKLERSKTLAAMQHGKAEDLEQMYATLNHLTRLRAQLEDLQRLSVQSQMEEEQDEDEVRSY